MRLLDAEQKLLALKQPVLQTRDVSACLNIPNAQASKILDRLAKADRFVRLMRGKWATSTQIDPLILPEYLTAPFPSYVSLQTALFYHGMISQIPHTIYAVSLARTHQYKTPFGTISIHHLQPDFFFDFEVINQVKIASPEKALLDVFYLTPTKSNLFKSLPELELPKSFDYKKTNTIINNINSPRIKTLVIKRFEKLLHCQPK
jgi:predicted transcriptional regulator of viral defense system